jgi:hypothetical protein
MRGATVAASAMAALRQDSGPQGSKAYMIFCGKGQSSCESASVRLSRSAGNSPARTRSRSQAVSSSTVPEARKRRSSSRRRESVIVVSRLKGEGP